MAGPNSVRRSLGFTLLELMIVMSLLLILVAIAVPLYRGSILRAKESVLRQDLFTLRSVIDQYTLDRQKSPQSLEDLVKAGYLRMLPTDPFTGRNDSWQLELDDISPRPDPESEQGIGDMHSGSDLTGSDGTAYSSW
jgi:general secretion pathway protein G